LSVFPLKIPPLRERPSDIKLLAEHFVERFARQMGKDIKGFTDEAMDRMMRHQWKGNVRELENVVQRAVLIAKGEYIDKEDLIIEDSVCGSITKGSIKDMEMEMILKTLKQTKGNKTQAARILGVSVRTIRNKLNNYYGKNLSRA
jgi:two-component system response regulator FlrC